MIYIRLHNLQPLCIAAEQAQGAIRRSLPYIPGSALRGALAANLRASQPELDQQQFAAYFLAPDACFQNLYPVPQDARISRSLPATTRTCKLYPGFVTQRKPKEKPHHGIRDQLYTLLREQNAAITSQATMFPAPHCHHPQGNDAFCTLPLEPLSRFYLGDQPNEYQLVEVRRRQVTQTAIDPHRETASPANLFTVEVLEEEQDFTGYFHLSAGIDEEEFCRTICSPGTQLRIGYGRTRGLGLVEVVECGVEEPMLWPNATDVTDRLATFNHTASAEGCTLPGYTLFSLTFLADTILLDPFFRYCPPLDGATLAREGYPALADATPVLALADARQIFGWSTPHGLPLGVDLAFTLGSTYVLQTRLSQADLAPALTMLENAGLGERRNEGFGQVVVCHPFHQEVQPI